MIVNPLIYQTAETLKTLYDAEGCYLSVTDKITIAARSISTATVSIDSTDVIKDEDFSGKVLWDKTNNLIFCLVSKTSSSSQHVLHNATIFNYSSSTRTINSSDYQENPYIIS